MRLRRIKGQPLPLYPPAEKHEEERKPQFPFKVKVLLLVLVVVLPLLFYWYRQTQSIFTTGRAVATQLRISSPFTGRIAFLSVREGDQVVQGQLLARMADAELNAVLNEAQTGLNEARFRLRALERAGLNPMVLAQMEGSERDLDLARNQHQRGLVEVERAKVVREQSRAVAARAERLLLLRAISRAQFERDVRDWSEAQADYAAAQAALSEANAAVKGAEKILKRTKEAVRYAQRKLAEERSFLRLEVERAAAEMRQVKARLDQTAIYAPRNSIVTWIRMRVGEISDHDDTILTLMDPEEVWIEAYVRGSDLSSLRDGLEALVTIKGLADTFKGRVSLRYPGRVPDQIIPVGPQQARSPSQLSDLTHSVRIDFVEEVPEGLRPEMIARVRIARR